MTWCDDCRSYSHRPECVHQSGKKSGEFCAGCGKAYDDHHGYPPACYTTTDSPRFEFQVGTKEANYRAALEAINRLIPLFATLDNARSIARDALGLDSQSVAGKKS